MGEARRRKVPPFWRNNVQPIQRKANAVPIAMPPKQVIPVKEIQIGDKSLSFVVPKMDCTVEKMIKEYVPQFEAEGYQIVATLQKGMQEVIRYVPRWVVLFRLGTTPEFNQDIGINNTIRIIKHMQKLGVRIVYYLDDFLLSSNQSAPVTIMTNCDAVIVATTELKEFLKKLPNFSVPIIHVPTHVDLPIFDFLNKLDFIDEIHRFKVLVSSGGRIGTILLHDMCEKADERWEEFDDVEWIVNTAGVAQLRTVINRFRNLHKTYLDWLPLEMYYSLCKASNVILNPASKEDLNYCCPPQWQETWLNSKSAVKYTMAGAARIPIISSPMRSYVEAIKDGETGFIVNSADEFLEKILYLKDNPKVLVEMGEKARKDVEENFNITKRYPLYRDAITGAFKEVDTSIGILIGKSDGGPGSFGDIMTKYIPTLTNNKYKVVEQDSPSVKAVISVAFLKHNLMRQAKERDPNIKFIQRMDGLPYVSYLGDDAGLQPGEIQTSVLEVMQQNYSLADHIVWQSKFCKKAWEPYVDTTKQNSIIYNGVDLEIFNTKGPVFPLPGSKTKILHVNWSLFPHKRVELLFKAIETFPEVEFYCVGNYEQLDTTATMQKFMQYPNATYYGPIRNSKQLVNLYRAVDALLFTSEMEGSPNSVLEAVACGCPVIYNNTCSVVPEMFGAELVFGFNTMDDLKLIIDKQLEDREFIQSVRHGLALKIEDYSAENMVRNYLRIIQ